MEELAGSLINLGMVEQRRGNLETAIAHDRRALDAFERVGHGSGRAIAYGNLADKLAEAERYAEAQSYADRALELAEAIGQPFAKANVIDTIAMIRAAEGDLRQAAERREEAAELYLVAGATRRAGEEMWRRRRPGSPPEMPNGRPC